LAVIGWPGRSYFGKDFCEKSLRERGWNLGKT